MDLGLQLTGFSNCTPLLAPPLMASLMVAMDLEQPDLPGFRVRIVVNWFLVFGLWTCDGSDLQWRDFLKENQTVGMLFCFTFLDFYF
ncbi:hypothetical protein Hanom_Chr04g00329901 [Helianthus anomalus]